MMDELTLDICSMSNHIDTNSITHAVIIKSKRLHWKQKISSKLCRDPQRNDSKRSIPWFKRLAHRRRVKSNDMKYSKESHQIDIAIENYAVENPYNLIDNEQHPIQEDSIIDKEYNNGNNADNKSPQCCIEHMCSDIEVTGNKVDTEYDIFKNKENVKSLDECLLNSMNITTTLDIKSGICSTHSTSQECISDNPDNKDATQCDNNNNQSNDNDAVETTQHIDNKEITEDLFSDLDKHFNKNSSETLLSAAQDESFLKENLKTSLQVKESDEETVVDSNNDDTKVHSPNELSLDTRDVATVLCSLERYRILYNSMLGKMAKWCPEAKKWNRIEALDIISKLLFESSIRCFNSEEKMPCVYSDEGLQVWKKEYGLGRIAFKAGFIVPVNPRAYARFASNVTLRKEWDTNLAEQTAVEELGAARDIYYIGYKRIATLSPRDMVTLRIRRKYIESPDNLDKNGHIIVQEPWEASDTSVPESDDHTYMSASCSLDHPMAPERSGNVRMDIRMNAYIARPFQTQYGLWSAVTLFSEIDPKGWIPMILTKTLSAKVFPSSVENFNKHLLKHMSFNRNNCPATSVASRMLRGEKF